MSIVTAVTMNSSFHREEATHNSFRFYGVHVTSKAMYTQLQALLAEITILTLILAQITELCSFNTSQNNRDLRSIFRTFW